MQKLLGFILAILLLGTIKAVEDATTAIPGIEDLDSSNFDKVITGSKHALVEFYAPWCGHCKRAVPELAKLAEELQEETQLQAQVVVAKVNADKDRKLGERFGIKGFPTFKFFPRGQKDKPIDYQGGRTSSVFLDYLRKKVIEDKVGRVDSIDAIIQNFKLAENKEELLEKVQKNTEYLVGDSKEYARTYIKYIKNVIAKGADYLEGERQRLNRIIESNQVSQSKVSDLIKRIRVIDALEGQ